MGLRILVALAAAATARLGGAADTTVNITEYSDATCTTVKRVQSFTLDKCNKSPDRLATCKGGIANVTWFTEPNCKGAFNSSVAYPTTGCTKSDKKKSYTATCF